MQEPNDTPPSRKRDRDQDDEGSGRGDDGGRLVEQLAPGALVAGVDLAAGVDEDRRTAAIGGCPQRAVWIAQLVDESGTEHQMGG